MIAPTPGQTVGPFFHDALPFEGDRELVPLGTAGSIVLSGIVRDGAGDPVADALLEIRQADPYGKVPTREGSLRRASDAFTGWGRSATDGDGRYWFSTLGPGPTRVGGAPFFAIAIFARGLLDRVFTRAYVPDDEAALAADPFLASLPPERRRTLVTTRTHDGGLRFDVHLQGPAETVFLSYPRHRGRR